MYRGNRRSKEGFNILVEARIKNAELVKAREMLGLTAKEASKRIDINYQSYLKFEAMKSYPNRITQKKICDFYRSSGIPLFEDILFPEYLKLLSPSKRRFEGRITREDVIPLSEIDNKLLSDNRDGFEIMKEQELKAELYKALSRLPHEEQEIIRMRYGLEGEKKSLVKTAEALYQNVCKERVRQIQKRAMKSLRSDRQLKRFSDYLRE